MPSKNSQWPCIQKNIGTWHGAFVQFSPEGTQVKETPSILTLEETEPGKTMALTLERTPAGEKTDIVRQSFNYPGPAPYVLFFESGAFSQGTPQWSAFGQFGAEMSLKVGDRRVRYVVMYEGTQRYTSQIKYVTLICETQQDGTPFAEPEPTVDQLSGEWTGTTQVVENAIEPVTTGRSHWMLSNEGKLTCQEQFDEGEQTLRAIASQKIDAIADNILVLDGDEETDLTYQLMLLGKGAYCLLPQEIRKEKAFRIEVGWVSQKGLRTRLIRYYDHRGVWIRSGLVEDKRT